MVKKPYLRIVIGFEVSVGDCAGHYSMNGPRRRSLPRTYRCNTFTRHGHRCPPTLR